MANNIASSEHTKGDCKHHAAFALKKDVLLRRNEWKNVGRLKYKHPRQGFWCRGYCAETVMENNPKSAEYIKRQLDEDKPGEQMTMRGKDDGPFKGGRQQSYAIGRSYHAPARALLAV